MDHDHPNYEICQVIEQETNCPECGGKLRLTSIYSDQLGFSCTSCSWGALRCLSCKDQWMAEEDIYVEGDGGKVPNAEMEFRCPTCGG